MEQYLCIPELADSDYVSVQTEKGKRGTIEDRNGTALATEGTVYSVGMVAGPKATQGTQEKTGRDCFN